MLKETKVVVKAGERVLILGAPGEPARRSCFARWRDYGPGAPGTSRARRGEQIFYLPGGTPYMPRGTLREVLAYPLKADSFAEGDFARALYRLGLERLARLLDKTQRWDRELSRDEQLCLAVARILLQRPPWVLIDGTFGLLADDVLELVIDRSSPTNCSTPASSTSADLLKRTPCSRASCISSSLLGLANEQRP